MKWIAIFIYCSIILSCTHLKTETNKEINVNQKSTDTFQIDTCLSKELLICINDYILDTKHKFRDDIEPLYSVYLFNKQDSMYIAIWAFTQFPNYLEHYNPKLKFKYFGFRIADQDVILITTSDLNDYWLFKPCNEKENYANELRSNRTSNIIYDGSWFLQTYTYNKSNSNIIKVDSVIPDILGQEFIDFEKYLNLNTQ